MRGLNTAVPTTATQTQVARGCGPSDQQPMRGRSPTSVAVPAATRTCPCQHAVACLVCLAQLTLKPKRSGVLVSAWRTSLKVPLAGPADGEGDGD